MRLLSIRHAFNEALAFVSGCSVLGGILMWAASTIWRFFTAQPVDTQKWTLNGGGIGGVAGLLVVLAELAV